MPALLTAADVERRARVAGASIAKLCRIAGIAPSAFFRWRAGDQEPRLESYRRIERALETVESAVSAPTEPTTERNPA